MCRWKNFLQLHIFSCDRPYALAYPTSSIWPTSWEKWESEGDSCHKNGWRFRNAYGSFYYLTTFVTWYFLLAMKHSLRLLMFDSFSFFHFDIVRSELRRLPVSLQSHEKELRSRELATSELYGLLEFRRGMLTRCLPGRLGTSWVTQT